jgi:Peptidase propeptide and YPEB domain
MKSAATPFGILLALISCNPRSGSPGNPESATHRESTRIDSMAARSTALAKVPGGQIVKQELEQEHGRLVYSFDIKRGGETGVQEVQVDARDGSVVSVEHEDAAREAAEAKQDSGAR